MEYTTNADHEKRLQYLEGATHTMLFKQDRTLEEIAELRKQFGTMQQDMHTIVAMYKTQQEALARIEAKLSEE